MTPDTRWRERIYEGYAREGLRPLAPDTVQGFRSRSYGLKRLISAHFPRDRDAPILEVGCGHGALIHFARELGYRNVRGIDGSPDQVAEARRLGIPGIERGELLATLRQCPSGSLAAVVAIDVIEHCDKADAMDFARETYRALGPGGRWIVRTVNGSSPFHGDIRYGDLTHELVFTRQSMYQLMAAAGFNKMTFAEDVPIVHGLKSAIRWFGWKCLRALLRLCEAIETGDTGKDSVYSRNFLIVATK